MIPHSDTTQENKTPQWNISTPIQAATQDSSSDSDIEQEFLDAPDSAGEGFKIKVSKKLLLLHSQNDQIQTPVVALNYIFQQAFSDNITVTGNNSQDQDSWKHRDSQPFDYRQQKFTGA